MLERLLIFYYKKKTFEVCSRQQTLYYNLPKLIILREKELALSIIIITIEKRCVNVKVEFQTETIENVMQKIRKKNKILK